MARTKKGQQMVPAWKKTTGLCLSRCCYSIHMVADIEKGVRWFRGGRVFGEEQRCDKGCAWRRWWVSVVIAKMCQGCAQGRWWVFKGSGEVTRVYVGDFLWLAVVVCPSIYIYERVCVCVCVTAVCERVSICKRVCVCVWVCERVGCLCESA